MNKRILVLGVILGGIFMANTVLASSITDNIVPSKYISVISQDFVDEHLEYKFTMVTDDHWHATFQVDNVSLAADIQSARNKQCTNIAWLNIKNTYFADDVFHTSVETCNAIKNMTNYPLHAGNDVSYSNFQWTQATANGSFDISFPHGWIPGTILDLGFGSTVAMTVTSTTSLSTTGRAICRGTNRVHMVFMNNSQVRYTNSSDGITWGASVRIDGIDDNSVPLEAPVIDCSGSFVFVAWIDTDARGDINFRVSADEGGDWTTGCIWEDGTGASDDAFHMGNVMFGAPTASEPNVWVTYSKDTGTPEVIYADNASNYWNAPDNCYTDGSTLTRTSTSMGVDCDASVYSLPTLFVNVSGTNEYVYAPYFCDKTNDYIVNYTNNSGTSWYSSIVLNRADQMPSLSFNIMNNNLYFDYIRMNYGEFSIYNSTDAGQTWSNMNSTESSYWSTSTASSSSNLYTFYTSVCTGTPSNNCDVGLMIWNTTNYTTTSYIDLNSNNATLPNAKWNASGPAGQSLIEYVYFNKTMIMYDFINLTSGEAPPPPPATCNYAGTGNWNIDCASNCDNTTQSLVVDGNLTIYSTGVGSVKFGNITAKKIDFNATHACAYYWHGRYLV